MDSGREATATVRSWARAQPVWLVDGLLAVGLAAIVLLLLTMAEPGVSGYEDWDGLDLPAVLLALLSTLPLAVRRRWPGAVLAAIGTAMVLSAALSVPVYGFGLVVALYTYAAWTTKDDAVVTLSVFSFFTLVSLAIAGAVAFAPVNFVVFFTAWVLGDRQRVQRLRTAELERRAEALEHERGLATALASALERTRIAQETHDVVAHGVSAMVAQATAAERLIPVDSERARVALEQAEAAGRDSLTELRRLIGLLRVGWDRPVLAPADLPSDTASEPANPTRRAGRVEGALRPRLSPRAVDVVIVTVLAAIDLSLLWLVPAERVNIVGYEGPTLAGALVLLAAPLPLLWRRRAPVAALCATVALGVLTLVVPVPTELLAPLVALYTVAARSTRRISFACLVAVLLLTAGLGVAFESFVALPHQWVVIATAWLLGDAQRARAERADALSERMRALVADRQRAGELAAVEERTRIARELHDVVAHSIGVMVVQAGAARRVLPTDPLRARAAAAQVGETGRHALAELRRLLGLLREEGSGAVMAPQPGLADLDELIAELSETPLHVTLHVDGVPRPLPAGLDLSAYRIVQESLTNALRHAGPAHVEVRLHWGEDHLAIDVADDGLGPLQPVGSASNGGHGLRGMQERAALVGGFVSTGARPGGGFLVTATLPLETT